MLRGICKKPTQWKMFLWHFSTSCWLNFFIITLADNNCKWCIQFICFYLILKSLKRKGDDKQSQCLNLNEGRNLQGKPSLNCSLRVFDKTRQILILFSPPRGVCILMGGRNKAKTMYVPNIPFLHPRPTGWLYFPFLLIGMLTHMSSFRQWNRCRT